MPLYDIHGNTITNHVSEEKALYNYQKWSGKTFVLHGNSLTKWGGYLADYLGMQQISLTNPGGSLTGNKSASELISYVETSYPNAVDLIILQGDGNTNLGGNPADQLDGVNPVNTWAARVNYLIRCLRARYPNVVIAMMADSVWYTRLNDQYSVEKNRKMYSEVKALAEYNRCAFFDVDHNTPFNPTHGFNNYYTGTVVGSEAVDGIHPNTKYLEAKGAAVAQYVAALVYNPDAPNGEVEGWQNRITYTITNTLTSVTNSNTAENWAANTPYSATLTGANTVSVTMGGVDVTADVYADGKVTINNITGDVVIVATAE
jgi:lysophospholipase L1-like esterase